MIKRNQLGTDIGNLPALRSVILCFHLTSSTLSPKPVIRGKITPENKLTLLYIRMLLINKK